MKLPLVCPALESAEMMVLLGLYSFHFPLSNHALLPTGCAPTHFVGLVFVCISVQVMLLLDVIFLAVALHDVRLCTSSSLETISSSTM